jgi:hypothetical protein
MRSIIIVLCVEIASWWFWYTTWNLDKPQLLERQPLTFFNSIQYNGSICQLNELSYNARSKYIFVRDSEQ